MDTFIKRRLKIYALRKLIQFRKELKWFSKIDIFRQDGFYCDYQDQLKNPLRITKNNYTELIDRLSKVRVAVNTLCEAFEVENMDEQIVNLRRDCIRKGYYNNIADSIKNMKMNRTDPFEWISKELNYMR